MNGDVSPAEYVQLLTTQSIRGVTIIEKYVSKNVPFEAVNERKLVKVVK